MFHYIYGSQKLKSFIMKAKANNFLLSSFSQNFGFIFIFLFLTLPVLPGFSQVAVKNNDKPIAPEIIPGKGLAQFDFFYAGEAKARNMYIIRKGRITWSYIDTVGRGEISDAVLMTNGNILFAHQFGLTLINKDKKILWNIDAPSGTEIHTAQPIGKDHVVFIRNADTAKLFVMNIRTGKTVKEFVLPVKNPKSVHGQFRHARLTPEGTILVAHMDMGKVCEYDIEGKELFWFDAPGVWSAEPLKNGNILVTSNKGYVREVNRKGETVWEYLLSDIPDYKISNPQIAIRRSNGNTIINNWFNQWSGTGKVDINNPPVQAIEVTPDKIIVWALRSWKEPFNLGPSTIIQLLDEPRVTENVHFGNIK
jgi:outer membrane protein assembly factor BamB